MQWPQAGLNPPIITSPWLPSGWALEGHQLRSPVKLKAAQAVGKNKMRVPKCAKSKGQSKRKSKVSKGQDVYSRMPLPDLQLDNPSLSISTKWKATAGHSTPKKTGKTTGKPLQEKYWTILIHIGHYWTTWDQDSPYEYWPLISIKGYEEPFSTQVAL